MIPGNAVLVSLATSMVEASPYHNPSCPKTTLIKPKPRGLECGGRTLETGRQDAKWKLGVGDATSLATCQRSCAGKKGCITIALEKPNKCFLIKEPAKDLKLFEHEFGLEVFEMGCFKCVK
ncbi:hypothetical protein FDECE_17837 [Fusarium decemcellulare]|nr:hypothetical protein FDECE_17837 [Fusarium decemcellulare]